MLSLSLLLAGVTAIVGLVVGLRQRPTVSVRGDEHQAAVTVDRHVRLWRGIGLALGLGLVLAVAVWGDGLGRWLAVAPSVLGGGVLLGVIIGERSAPIVRGQVRSAELHTRRLTQEAPRHLVRWVLVASVALLASLTYGVMRGSVDDGGRAGRSLVRTCLQRQDGKLAEITSGMGPWPGSFYVVPVVGALGVVALLAVVAAHAVARRPRAGVEDRALDSLLRRWGSGNVVTVMLMTLLATLGPLAFAMAAGLLAGVCRSPGDVILASVLFAVAVGATGAAAALLGVLLSPARIVVADGPRSHGGPGNVDGAHA